MAISNAVKSYQVTPAQFAAALAHAEDQGVEVPEGNKGTITTHGFVVDFVYDGTANLTLTATGLPWFAFGNANMVWDYLDPLFVP